MSDDNGTPMAATLIDLLRDRSGQMGDAQLFSYVPGPGPNGHEHSLTYRGLHERAMAIGGALQSATERGERALLLFPPGLDFVAAFFGCLYSGVVAVPVSPARRNRSPASLQEICDASQPVVVLTVASHLKQSKSLYAKTPGLLKLPWLAVDEVADDSGRGWTDPQVDGRQLAFLQYTSGSTALPKGVMLSHENLLYNCEMIHQAFGTAAASRAVFWLPLHHDMGLIGGILQPIYCGGSSTLLPPASFLQRPLSWLETISRTRATISGGPDFAYDLCTRKISAAERKALDLSCWEVAFTGAEPIRAGTLDRFAATFGDQGFSSRAFFPCYGLAEATLIVSGGPRQVPPTVVRADAEALTNHRIREANGGDRPARRLIGCGTGMPGQEVAIVDPDTRRPCAAGRIGEIWVRGPSVAMGYFAKPDATRATFKAHIEGTNEGPFLRTGDLGFLRDSQLFVTGRLKDLIIIRGRNYYPQDIEQAVELAHGAFRVGFCAAFSVDVEERESLVIVQEIEPRQRNLDAESALRAVRETVADRFELEIYAIILAKAGTILKTSSGKTRRSACRDRYLGGQQDVIAQWTATWDDPEDDAEPWTEDAVVRTVTAREIEQWLAQRIAARLKIARHKISVATPFLEFGIGSMDAVQIVADLERWLGRQLSPTAIYNYPNIDALARHLANNSPRSEKASLCAEGESAAPEGTPEEILREVQELSQEEIETYILQEMAKQEGT